MKTWLSTKKRLPRLTLLAATVAGAFGSDTQAVAATLPVMSCADDGSVGTLRSVLAHSATGDIVDMSALTCSRITLASGALSVTSWITLQGPGQNALTIDGANADRVISSKNVSVTLKDLSLAHGRVNGNGGCLYSKQEVFLYGVTVNSCSAAGTDAYGGGVSANDIKIRDSTVSGNAATAQLSAKGGGLYAGGVFGGVVDIGNSTISGNRVSGSRHVYGGGVEAGGSGAEILIGSSVISGNTATGGGSEEILQGGGLNTAFGSIYLNDSTISGNVVVGLGGSGGGLSAHGAHITGSTIDHNSAPAAGGVCACGDTSGVYLTLVDSTISGNRATVGTGGGISGYGLTSYNNTIAFNYAADGGGGVYALVLPPGPTALKLQSTIIADNAAGAGAMFAADLGTNGALNALTVMGTHNLIGSAQSTITLPPDTLRAEPQLFALANNGGPTSTHALRAGSPAIDAGNNVSGLSSDQRGPGFARVVGAAADIGAFEKQNPLDGDVIFKDGFDPPG
jgi:hypothetical protein